MACFFDVSFALMLRDASEASNECHESAPCLCFVAAQLSSAQLTASTIMMVQVFYREANLSYITGGIAITE